MVTKKQKSIFKKALKLLTITILLLIKFVIRNITILFLILYVFGVEYRYSARYEMQKYFESETYKHLYCFKIAPKNVPVITNDFSFNPYVLIQCRTTDEEFEEIKEEVMILKEDVENYLKEHSDDFSDKEINVYIVGDGVKIEMKNNTNDEDFYNLEFEYFRLNHENILESINDEMNAD